jgi:curved DNA-binding protein CbpA
MTKIIIENEKVDPYFIVGVSKEDSREIIELMYKRKAKLLHPDKSKLKNKEMRDKNFRILQECFEYIKTKHFNEVGEIEGRQLKNNNFGKNFVKKNKNSDSSFNKEFEKSRTKRPEDFGYSSNRIQTLDEYNDFNYKPTDVFDGKRFNPNDFNKMFEYNKNMSEEYEDSQLVQKTTDGFYAYNSGGCDSQVAAVSNYNGLMLVGDNYGESGVGYSGSNFGDFKQSFKSAHNPVETIEKIGNLKLDKEEEDTGKINKNDWKKRIKERVAENDNINRHVLGAGASSKAAFRNENEKFEKKKKDELIKEIELNKRMVLEYSHMFNENLIEDAKNGNLEVSKDTVVYTEGVLRQPGPIGRLNKS